MRKLVPLLIVTLLLPASAQAQTKKRTTKGTTHVYVTSNRGDCCWGNRWSLEPYAGMFEDPYDISPDGDESGTVLGLRVGYRTGGRTRVSGNFGYSDVDNVASATGNPGYYVYDNTWLFTTLGGEFDVVPGRTSAAIGVQGGAAWRRVDLDGTVGVPIGTPQNDRGFSAQEVVIPSLVVRHGLTSRITITAGLHDYIFDFLEGTAKHGVGLTAGVAFR